MWENGSVGKTMRMEERMRKIAPNRESNQKDNGKYRVCKKWERREKAIRKIVINTERECKKHWKRREKDRV